MRGITPPIPWGEIPGLNFDGFKSDELNEDNHFFRMTFSGLTETELGDKLLGAEKWLKDNKIEYGKTDGKVACIFKCMTSEQL